MRILVLMAACLSLLSLAADADTLDEVLDSGRINCGIGSDRGGFSTANSLGEYSGFDVDFCRAVASAVFDDPEAVDLSPAGDEDSFEQLTDGRLHLLGRTTALTLANSVKGVQFVGVSYYDGQGFMVNRERGLRSALELDRTPLCVTRDARSESKIIDFFTINRMRYNPIFFDDEAEAYAALESGQCSAIAANKSTLAAQRARFKQPGAFVLLPDVISKNPLGPIVRSDDDQWQNIVRWTLNCMINAEELGIDSDNVARGRVNTTLAARRLLGLQGDEGSKLGLSADWCARIVRHVGNYGEIYERNIGKDSPLALQRGVNHLWTDGGLVYALPVH